jgi:alcohol dehydrogenase
MRWPGSCQVVLRFGQPHLADEPRLRVDLGSELENALHHDRPIEVDPLLLALQPDENDVRRPVRLVIADGQTTIGIFAELPDACRALGIARPLLVTDPALAQPVIGHRALEIARAAGLALDLFADVRPNPTAANVAAGVDAFRGGRHGGGSGLDAGKAIAFMASQARPIWDFEDRGDNWRRAGTAKIAPVVAIPTTAGTGSEVGRAAVITNEETRAKCIVFHARMLPGQVIADPELTLELPAQLTAWTGLDALSHSLEALCAPGFHPMADGIATEAIRLIHGALEPVMADGRDLVARAHMLTAASMGAVAFQKGLGAIHALARSAACWTAITDSRSRS